MLRSLKALERYTLSATDGDIGSVVDFLLDDEHWTLRYLVADTGGFLDGRRVLISPISFRETHWVMRRFHLALTKEKIARSPSVDVAKPVSRQHERDFYRYYGYPYYWGYSGLWGMESYPGLLAGGRRNDNLTQQFDTPGDVHLRSAQEVRGYHVQGSDEAIGQIEDFVVDDETWQVRYLVIDTNNWWFGKKVLIAPHWAKSLSWEERKVFVDLSRRAIQNSPEWDPTAAIDLEYEAHLYDYYGWPAYRDSSDRPGAPPPGHRSGSHPG